MNQCNLCDTEMNGNVKADKDILCDSCVQRWLKTPNLELRAQAIERLRELGREDAVHFLQKSFWVRVRVGGAESTQSRIGLEGFIPIQDDHRRSTIETKDLQREMI